MLRKCIFLFIIFALISIDLNKSVNAANYEVIDTNHYISLANSSNEYQNCFVENKYILSSGQISKITFKAEYSNENLFSYSVEALLFKDNKSEHTIQNMFFFEDKERAYNFESASLNLKGGPYRYSAGIKEGASSFLFMTELTLSYFKSTLNKALIPIEEKNALSITYIGEEGIITHDIETNMEKQLEIMDGCFNPVLTHGERALKEKKRAWEEKQ